MRLPLLLVLACALAAAQPRDPAADPLEKAYQALRTEAYQEALDRFHEAAQLAPSRASIRKELGYTYLKMRNSAAARELFLQALRLDPLDSQAALQAGFLYEADGDKERAHAFFESAAGSDDPELSQRARQALDHLRPNDEPKQSGPRDGLQDTLNGAYAALGAKDYGTAIARLQQALGLSPQRTDLVKELAYAYLKIGETAAALDLFEQAHQLEPGDEHVALELGFLCYESGRHARAIELFQQLTKSADAGVRSKAETAHQTVDGELRRGIERWTNAAEIDPNNRSIHLELGDLYEKRGEPAKAAEQYFAAWAIPGEDRTGETLLKLARARDAAGDPTTARAAWLLASRSEDTRVAETARDHLPERFPYASEFRQALELDPDKTTLRRELAYLLLKVGLADEARLEFETILERDPHDLLSAAQLADLYLERGNAGEAVKLLERARESPDEEVARRARDRLHELRDNRAQPHREMGEKNLEKSYLNEARREFLRAYELNPDDHTVALKLGVVYNLLGQDAEAIRMFRVAAASPDPAVAAQADQSYRNLAPQFRKVTTSFWTFPIFSSRYKTVFNYAQIKSELRLASLPLHPYLSLRFAGDIRQRTGGPSPQFLSESALIAAFGMRTPTRHGVTGWGEAGEALNLLNDRPPGVPRAGPDYRGGVNWLMTKGASLGSGATGRFLEVSVDGVYLSRFDNDVLAYLQVRPGYRLADRGWLRAQLLWNFNLTVDAKREYWANFVETGPGVRFRLPGTQPPLDLSLHLIRGSHLVNESNPRAPNYWDVRAHLWYSLAR